MIKKILKTLIKKTAVRGIEDYTHKVSMCDREHLGVILSHACLIFAQLVKIDPVIKKVIASKDDIYGKEVSALVLETNGLLKEYVDDGDTRNASGVELWNETFRCLRHPEFTH